MSCAVFLSWICDLMDEVTASERGEMRGYADDLAGSGTKEQ